MSRSSSNSESAASSTFRSHSNQDDEPEVKEDQEHQCNIPVRAVAAVCAGEPSRGRGRRASRDSDKTAQCARITTENERARTEAEAAGCHVRDYATGYGTTTTMPYSGGGEGRTG